MGRSKLFEHDVPDVSEDNVFYFHQEKHKFQVYFAV